MRRLRLDKWWQTWCWAVVIPAALATPPLVNPLLAVWLP